MKNKKIVIGIITLGLLTSLQSGAGVQAKKTENKLQVKQKKITMTVGEKKKIKITAKKKFLKKLVWKSSNKKIVAVNQKGVVKAKKKGTAKITVFVKKNKKIKTSFTVKVNMKSEESTEKVKEPATMGAVQVSASSVEYAGCLLPEELLPEGWYYDQKSLQKQYNPKAYSEDIRNDMTLQVMKYDADFFQDKVLYYIPIEKTDSTDKINIKGAQIKKNEEGEWICEVTGEAVRTTYMNVATVDGVIREGMFLEFDKEQVQGVSKVEIVVNKIDVYLSEPVPAPMQ